MIAIGIMSGTSGDGIDAAAIELDVPAKDVRVLATSGAPYPKNIRDAVLALGEGGMSSAADIARLHGLLGDRYAEIAARLVGDIAPRRADVIALHGQTVAHLPDEHVTFQIGDAARVARRTGIPVVDDLRSADVAAGGHGAPLVSFADLVLFGRLAPVEERLATRWRRSGSLQLHTDDDGIPAFDPCCDPPDSQPALRRLSP